MIDKIDITRFKKDIGVKTQIHKVAHFSKENMDLLGKNIIIADFEFTTQYNIYEITVMKVKNGKIIDIWYEEFKVPPSDTIFDFNVKRPVRLPGGFNSNKNEFTKEKRDKLISVIEESDFFVAHNYVAEMQCIHKLKFPELKYDVLNIELYNQGKIICTNKSFNNKHFKQLDIFNNGFSNENVSNSLGWDIEYKKEDKLFILSNNRTGISIKVDKLPESFIKSKTSVGIHNSLFDTLITYTSFLSLEEFI